MHILCVGNSYSGKTNLMKRFAADLAAKGEGVAVYDPLGSSGWPASAKKYKSAGPFLKFMDSAQKTHVFIDEAKTLWDYDQTRANAILYQKRHQGLLIYLIAQRTRMVPPNARNQCSRVFIFKQQLEDSKTLSQEYDELLKEAVNLGEGEFIASNGFRTQRLKLDYTGNPPLPPKVHLREPYRGQKSPVDTEGKEA